VPDPRDFFRTLLSGPEATTPPPRPRTAPPPPAEPPSWFDTVVEGGMRGLGAGVYYLGDLMRGATLGGDEGRTVSGFGEVLASALPLVGGAKALKTAARAAKMENFNQAQSVSWEAVKGLFSPSDRRNPEFRAQVKRLWEEYSRGKMSLGKLHDRIEDLAGGVDEPAWAKVVKGGTP